VETEPAGHRVQESELLAEKLPGGQEEAADIPELATYEPGGEAVHAVGLLE